MEREFGNKNCNIYFDKFKIKWYMFFKKIIIFNDLYDIIIIYIFLFFFYYI